MNFVPVIHLIPFLQYLIINIYFFIILFNLIILNLCGF